MDRLSALGVLGTSLVAALTLGSGGALARVPGGAPHDSVRAGGTIIGLATTKEPVPKPVRVTIDPSICGQSLPDESVVVDAAGHLANVVVTAPGVKVQQPAEAL